MIGRMLVALFDCVASRACYRQPGGQAGLGPALA
jgi:hypothetical protein